MRAVYAQTFGGDDPLANLQIGDIAVPELGPGMARVRVTAAALNHHDLWTLRGVSSRPLTGRQVLGCDAAGVVESYADGQPEGAPAIGARVVVHTVMTCRRCSKCLAGNLMACPRIGLLSEPGFPGALAETVDVPVGNLVALPDTVDDTVAACLPTAYLTAYRMIFVRAALTPGQTLLVQGATGGVATAAILLAHDAGITVYATSRTEATRRVALDLGAVMAFDSTDRAVFKEILAATDGGVDAVIDSVGEPTWDLSLRSLRAGGTVVTCGTTGGANPRAQLSRVFWKHLTIAGSSVGTRQELERLVELCARGGLMPLVDSVTPLGDVASAFATLDQGAQRGKMVIRVAEA